MKHGPTPGAVEVAFWNDEATLEAIAKALWHAGHIDLDESESEGIRQLAAALAEVFGP
jgi:hypothetical protein